jgi:putative ABC transport system ATP-binding protein
MRRNTIGFVFQSYNLIPRMNALENVELGQIFRGIPRSQRRKNALRALELVGLSDRIHHIPAEMSGGQQQRVAIARAIVGEPRLILADEPTGNLDSISAAQIMKILKSLNSSGVTVALITHDREIASHAHRVIGDTKQKI